MNEEELKNYEISFLAKEEGGREDVLQLIKKHDIEVSGDSPTARIKLAYSVKKEHFGHFGCIYFSAKPEVLEALREGLKINPQILRFSIGRTPRLKDEDGKKTFTRQTRRSSYARAELKSHLSTDALGEKEEDKVKRREESRVHRPPQEEFKGELSNEALEKKLEEILK